MNKIDNLYNNLEEKIVTASNDDIKKALALLNRIKNDITSLELLAKSIKNSANMIQYRASDDVPMPIDVATSLLHFVSNYKNIKQTIYSVMNMMNKK
jgi:hypothetical protein